MNFLVTYDLKLEISDGRDLVKFAGMTLPPAGKALDMSGQTSEKISET